MAWLPAPVLTPATAPTGVGEPILTTGVLVQGALDTRHWISPFDATDSTYFTGTRSYASAS